MLRDNNCTSGVEDLIIWIIVEPCVVYVKPIKDYISIILQLKKKRVVLCQNPLDYTLKMCAPQCMHTFYSLKEKNFNKKKK